MHTLKNRGLKFTITFALAVFIQLATIMGSFLPTFSSESHHFHCYKNDKSTALFNAESPDIEEAEDEISWIEAFIPAIFTYRALTIEMNHPWIQLNRQGTGNYIYCIPLNNLYLDLANIRI